MQTEKRECCCFFSTGSERETLPPLLFLRLLIANGASWSVLVVLVRGGANLREKGHTSALDFE